MSEQGLYPAPSDPSVPVQGGDEGEELAAAGRVQSARTPAWETQRRSVAEGKMEGTHTDTFRSWVCSCLFATGVVP